MANAWQTVEQAAITLGISTRTIARRIAKTELESRLSNGRREVYIRLPDGYVAPPEQSAPPQQSQSNGPTNPFTHERRVQPEHSTAESEQKNDAQSSSQQRVHVVTIEGELTGADAPGYQEEYEQTVRQTVAASKEGFDIETSAALILAEDRARRAEMAIAVISQSSAIMQNEVRIARVGARWAWGIAAALFVCVSGAVCWTVAVVTKSQQQAEAIKEKIGTIQERSEQVARDREQVIKDHKLLRKDLDNAIAGQAVAEGQLLEMKQEADQARAQIASMTQEAREKEKAKPTFGQKLANTLFGAD